MKEITKGALLASMVAGLFACGGSQEPAKSAEAEGDTVKCGGINACKNNGACSQKASEETGDAHGCKGMNSCKGKGWVKVSAIECAEKGGKQILDEG